VDRVRVGVHHGAHEAVALRGRELAAALARAAEAAGPRAAADLSEFAIPRRGLLSLVERRSPRGLPYVPDAPLPAASLNGMLG
jgi:hypothetical protein